jgi:hypothetical protein
MDSHGAASLCMSPKAPFRLQLDEQRGDRSATLLGGGRMSVRIVRTIASTAALSSIPRAEDALSGSGRLPGSACELRKVAVFDPSAAEVRSRCGLWERVSSRWDQSFVQ